MTDLGQAAVFTNRAQRRCPPVLEVNQSMNNSSSKERAQEKMLNVWPVGVVNHTQKRRNNYLRQREEPCRYAIRFVLLTESD